MGIEITTTGSRELSAHLESFPPLLHRKLTERIQKAMLALWEGSEEVVPHLTGRLASELHTRLFSDAQNRVAGYLSVYTPDPGPHNEYAKAATLEYGSSKARAVRDNLNGVMTRLAGSSRRIKARMSAPVDIAARRYLRGPFETMRPEILAAIEEAIAEAVAESDTAGAV